MSVVNNAKLAFSFNTPKFFIQNIINVVLFSHFCKVGVAVWSDGLLVLGYWF